MKIANRILSLTLATLIHFSLAAQGEGGNQTVFEKISAATVFEEPIVYVGSAAPSEGESGELLESLEIGYSDASKAVERLEGFLASHPESPWGPSLRASLAQSYREAGRYTQALEHWEKAWKTIENQSGNNVAHIGDFILINWTSLLASLGRTEMLGEIIHSTKGRTMKNVVWQKRFNDIIEGLAIMKRKPGIAYKCGTFALANVGRQMGVIDHDAFKELLAIPSPETGFSLTALTEYSKKYNLGLTAMRRSVGGEIIVPSVIHWKQKHYAAIVAEKSGHYRVIDPTFGTDKWLKADAINAEASGIFLVSITNSQAGWVEMARLETDLVFGKGYPNWKPPERPPCPENTCCPNGGATGGGGNGGSGNGGTGNRPIVAEQQSCGPCGGGPSGMAAWSVSEPNILLSVTDMPLSYQPSRGHAIHLKVNFHQDERRPINNAIYNFGPYWNANFLNYIEVTDAYDDPAFADYIAILYAPNGGESKYTAAYPEPDMRDHSTFGRHLSGTNVTFSISYPNGSRAIYDLVKTVSTVPQKRRAFMTQWISPEGYANVYQYSTNSSILLTNIVDVDSRNTRIIYDTNFPSQVSRVISPYTNEAKFFYNSTNGILTNIIDTVGISSQFRYAWSNGVPLMTNLATPYGNTSFKYYGPGTTSTNLGTNTIVDTQINMAIEVTEPTGGRHLFIYKDDHSVILGDPGYYYEDVAEFFRLWSTLYFYPYNSLIGNIHLNYRNSFYWSPLQSQELPDDFENFTASDYLRARMRHWLHGSENGWMIWTAEGGTVSQTLEMEQSPSPDGVSAGRKIWYGYTGNLNGYTYAEGTNALPAVTAYTLDNLADPYPWDQTNLYFIYKEYNRLGKTTLSIESYTGGETVDLRTNVYEYASNDIDMTRHTLLVDGVAMLQESNVYNGFHQVLTNYDALSQVTSYIYDANRRLTSTKRPSGLTTTNLYYSSGELKQTIDIEISRTNSYSYENGQIKSHTNELGLVKIYHWDALNRITGTSFPSDGSYTTNLYYLPAGVTLPGGTGTNILDVTATTDRLTNWTYFAYNGVRQRVAITNALNNATFYNYCACGALESIEDALGNETHFHYDNAGRLTNTVYADGSGITNFYSSSGRLTNTIDSAGVSVTNWFNLQGLVIASSNAFGQVFLRQYDIEDRLTNSVDANGVSIDMSYDELGRVLTRAYPDAGVEQFGYSARGLIAYTNQLLTNITRYAYNEAGWKTFETNANQEVTQFRYDASGNLTNLFDGKSQMTVWMYDIESRVTSKLDDLGSPMFAYRYNANGWLTNRWTPEKLDTYYSYDKVGNLTNVNYANSTDLRLGYDKMNRVTNMVDTVGTTKFGYTEGGFLAYEDGPWVNDTISYSYEDRKRSAMYLLAPNSSTWSQSYHYDDANRLTNIVSPAGSFIYTYQPSLGGVTTSSRLIKQIALSNGANITNEFDVSARLLKTHLRDSTSALLNSHEYTYNVVNQRMKQTRTAGDFVDYTYDRIGQLKTAFGKESGGSTSRLQEQMGYAYDAAGNLSRRTNNALIQNFGVNSLNQLSNVTRNTNSPLTVAGTTTSEATSVLVGGSGLALGWATLYNDFTWARAGASPSGTGPSSYTAFAQDALGRKDTNSVTVYLPTNAVYAYDLNGNLTNDSKHVFSYDDENQLTGIIVASEWRAEFAYDGKMRRRIERNYEWRNNAWVKTSETRFVYDGNLVVQERNENNLPQVTLTRGKDLSGSLEGAGGIGGLLARSEKGAGNYSNGQIYYGGIRVSSYYHSDGNGNVTMLIDGNQHIAAKYIYDPFGKTLSKSGPLADANRYQFSSKPIHELSGMYDYLYRWYVPEIQRWLNRDPIQEAGGINLYSFVSNSPSSFVDAFGLELIDSKCAEAAKAAYDACYGRCDVALGVIAATGAVAAGACTVTGVGAPVAIGVGVYFTVKGIVVRKACRKTCQEEWDKNMEDCKKEKCPPKPSPAPSC